MRLFFKQCNLKGEHKNNQLQLSLKTHGKSNPQQTYLRNNREIMILRVLPIEK